MFLSFFLLLSIFFLSAISKPFDINDVSTLYGTYGLLGGIAALPTGVQYPLGMVRLSPDTVNEFNAWIAPLHAGGYYYPDKYIRVFSHVHTDGAGAQDYGNIGIMPLSIPWQFDVPDFRLHLNDYNFKSSYNKSDAELIARPGYWRTILEDTEASVELTSTRYVGLHRYGFRAEENRQFVVFYPSHSLTEGGCHASEVTIDPAINEISGWILNFGSLSGRGGGVKIYFVARFGGGQVQNNYGVWDGNTGKVYSGRTQLNGTDIGAFIEISSSSIEVYVGISFISIDQARMNLMADVLSRYESNFFDSVIRDTTAAWITSLSSIQITSSSLTLTSTFYDAFYRTLTAPTLFSETGNVYLGFDNQIHSIDPSSSACYSDLSIWDVHRSQLPLLGLLFPSVLRDIILSLKSMYLLGGDLPRWPIANHYTGCMIGQHATVVITEGILKGLEFNKNDLEILYSGMRQGATVVQKEAGREIFDWVNYGWIPSDNVSRSTCHTLAYAYDDGILARAAKFLGKEADVELFSSRSLGYKHNWNPDAMFFCPKSLDGKWDCPKDFTDVFDPRYIEGDAWHWRFFVLHDPEGLISLFGKKETFISELSTFLSREFEFPYTEVPNKYFWVGNEHNLGSPFLFNFAGRPDLTAKYVPKVIKTYFSSDPSGDPGNDDYGETSSWAVFAMLGFYPIAGSTKYSIASPMFDSVRITLGEKCVLTMDVDRSACGSESEGCVYVKSITIGGKPHSDLAFFDHVDDFVANCPEVKIVMVMAESLDLN